MAKVDFISSVSNRIRNGEFGGRQGKFPTASLPQGVYLAVIPRSTVCLLTQDLVDHDAWRMRNVGFSNVTTVLGGTLSYTDAPAPMTEFRPIVVVPPRTVAFA